jgi:alanine racemase
MTLRLTVQRQAWLAHVDRTIAAYAPATVAPVVKGNGYGFGRATLFAEAATRATHVCVGTVHELDGIPAALTPVVLTPAGPSHADPSHTGRPRHTDVVATVADRRDMDGLAAGARVLVKLRSSMWRYGVAPDGLADLLAALHHAGAEVIGASIHLPLAGGDDDRLAEVMAWLPHLPEQLALWVSHLAPSAVQQLLDAAGREVVVRLGTALWHGDKSFLHLTADVAATHRVRAGQRVGYRQVEVPADGTLVMVTAGSAHGVIPLDDGRSPFHFAARRLALVEAPHMHTSMVFVPDGEPVPEPGDRVDVQRPLIMTAVDEIEWV